MSAAPSAPQLPCRAVDQETMYPNLRDKVAVAAAKAVCATCWVAERCLRMALELRDFEGVWGGLTGPERRDRARPREVYTVICVDCGADFRTIDKYRMRCGEHHIAYRNRSKQYSRNWV